LGWSHLGGNGGSLTWGPSSRWLSRRCLLDSEEADVERNIGYSVSCLGARLAAMADLKLDQFAS
jgi:hypothetical protein